MVPQDADADIDDVLKQSEALLDRLHANQSERDLDGGASLSSLTSLGSLMNGSVKELTTPTNVMSPKRTIRVKIAPGGSQQTTPLVSPLFTPKPRIDPLVEGEVLHDVPDLEAAPTMPTVNTSSREVQQQLPPPSPGRPPNWEKVSSAAQGDDDFVPMMDYSQLKRSATQALPRPASSKVSRLEAYRKMALRRRRRRRAIGFAVAIVLVIAYWMYSSRGREGFNKKIDDRKSLEMTAVKKESEIPVVQKEREAEPHYEPTDGIGEVDGDFLNRDESEDIHDVSAVLVEEEVDYVEVLGPSSSSQAYRGDVLLVTNEFTDGLVSPPTGQGRELDHCKHPLAKFLAKSCQNVAPGPRLNLYLLIEKPVKAFVENPIFLVV